MTVSRHGRRGGASNPQVKLSSTRRHFGTTRIVAPVEGQIAARAADAIAEMKVRDLESAVELAGIGVDQQLVGVEAMAFIGRIGAIDPVTIEQPRARFRQVAVPNAVGV